MFPYATPADIMRSAQKDEYYITGLKQSLSQVFRYYNIRNPFKYLAEILYYTLTMLQKRQTIGEEYSDIVMVRNKQRLGLLRRAVLMMCLVFGKDLLYKLIKRVKEYTDSFDQKEGSTMSWILDHVKQMMESFNALHLAIFYFTGAYYHISRRLVGARYILIRKLRPGESREGYEVLGVLLCIQLLTSLLKSRNQPVDFDDSEYATDKEVPENKKCTLCLEAKKVPTVTNCGHVFCWKCIADWCRTKPECPLCRQTIFANRLLPLYNYE